MAQFFLELYTPISNCWALEGLIDLFVVYVNNLSSFVAVWIFSIVDAEIMNLISTKL